MEGRGHARGRDLCHSSILGKRLIILLKYFKSSSVRTWVETYAKCGQTVGKGEAQIHASVLISVIHVLELEFLTKKT